MTVWPSGRLAAQSDNSGALFLSLPIGAQAVGMGQTAVTLEGRGEAAFWNPAGLATIPTSELAVENATLSAGSAHAITAYFPSHSIGVFGGAIYMLDYGSLERTDSSNSVTAHMSPRNYELLASYSTAFAGSFSVGINYKLVEFRVDCSGECDTAPRGEGVTHGLDVGGQLNVGPDGALRLGLAVRNIGFKLQVNNRDQADPLPARVVVGALYRLGTRVSSTSGRGPGAAGAGGGGDAEAGTGRIDVELAADLDRPWGDGESEMRFGFDVGYQRLLRLRGGYAFVPNGVSGPSFGMGLSSGSIGIDLARTFVSGSDFVSENPTFFTFHVVF